MKFCAKYGPTGRQFETVYNKLQLLPFVVEDRVKEVTVQYTVPFYGYVNWCLCTLELCCDTTHTLGIQEIFS